MGLLFPKKENKIYSVDEITTYIKNILEDNKVLENVQVRGEISNFKHHNKRHMYFDLKDENSIIHCAMFWNVNKKLKFKPKEGIKVIVKGHIDVYKIRGSYQIIVEKIQLAGKGALYQKYLKLKEDLEKEGLFKEKFKKPLPEFPKKLGVITSFEGAAVQDIIKVIKRRFPHLNLIIYPSLVQGNEAKYQIEKGIKTLNQLQVDAIIVARGGGSFENLWPFNEENVARAIFASEIPIITGIGHETDFTIADFVADEKAPTPSAAAEISVPDIIEIKKQLLNLERRLNKDLIKIREDYKQKLNYIKSRPVFKRPNLLIEQDIQMVDDEKERIIKIFTNKNKLIKMDVIRLKERINALGPESILKRGYSITMKKGKIIKSTKNIKRKDIISTILSDGKINSKVE